MKTLFDITSINDLKLKNRFMRSATWENMVGEDGQLPDKLLSIYEDMARGGVGLIVTGTAYVSKAKKTLSGHMSLNNDRNIIYYEKLTKIVHCYQTKIILQVNYTGENEEMPSPIELSKEKIKDLITDFGNTALRAKRAGFDGIQIHAAHSFSLSKFLSMSENKRNDEYGGSLENNPKLIIEIIKEIRIKTGKSFHIFVKIDCINSIDTKNIFDVFVYTSKQLSKLGISGIEISGDVFNKLPNEVLKYKESIFRDQASFIAQEINTPIILVGFNRSPEVMNEILNKTNIEYFSISRPLIREPNLINIWQKNSNYRPKCISCNKCFKNDGNKCVFTN